MPVVPSLEVERYLDFKDMTAYLRDVGKAAPHLVRVFSIGKSREGRPLLVAEVTNRNLKKGREKPGLWIDGGHQGWNLLGTMGCLELLRFLVSGHGRDEFLTDLVDHNVFYIAPRLAPDEMEACLATGAIVPQAPGAGPLVPTHPRQFRLESPLGSWTPFKRDNRILVKRQPEDRKGPFYDLYRHLDSSRLAAMAPTDFPSKVAHSGSEAGPLQLASTRAVFEFLRSYQNVFAVISTSGPGDHLRLVVGAHEEAMFRGLGQRLGELCGLPCSSVVPDDEAGGGFLAWAVESLGVLSVDCQMWSLRAAAGLKEEPGVDPLYAEETEMMQVLRFCEKEFPDGSFSEWKESEESDLGSGELGGWDWSRTWLNPPAGPYLGRELKRFSRLALGLASAGPRLVIAEVQEKVLGWSENEPLRHLSVRIENRGYLPTCPVGRKDSGGANLTASCIKGDADLLIGEANHTLEDLQGTGFSQIDDGLPYAARGGHKGFGKRSIERDFLFRGNADIEITVSHPMAGIDKVVSRPTQILKPPAFGGPTAAQHSPTSEPSRESNDPFEDAFPSFEELYNEPETAPLPPVPQRRPSHPAQQASSETRLIPDMPATRPAAGPGDEFGIPMPPLPDEGGSRKVEFPSIGGGSNVQGGPFPNAKPSKGRVFGSPPQKPGSNIAAGLGGGVGGGSTRSPLDDPMDEGDFSPLPLVKSASTAFEPLMPKSATPPPVEEYFDAGPEGYGLAAHPPSGAETMGGRPPAPRQAPPASLGTGDENPSAPPARLSRISAPQLLRRQRGAGSPPGQGPTDPFHNR